MFDSVFNKYEFLLNIIIFWAMVLCRLVSGYQHVGEAKCLPEEGCNKSPRSFGTHLSVNRIYLHCHKIKTHKLLLHSLCTASELTYGHTSLSILWEYLMKHSSQMCDVFYKVHVGKKSYYVRKFAYMLKTAGDSMVLNFENTWES